MLFIFYPFLIKIKIKLNFFIIKSRAIYEEGGYNDIIRDYNKAYECYSFAAELNDSRGFLNIGYMHEKVKQIQIMLKIS